MSSPAGVLTSAWYEITTAEVVFAFVIVVATTYIVLRLRGLESVLQDLGKTMRELRDIRAEEQAAAVAERDLRGAAVVGAAATIAVFTRAEIHQSQEGSFGIGVFGVRSNNGETIFALGLTRSVDSGPPPLTAMPTVVSGYETVELSLVLPPAEPPLELAETVLWYRDQAGRYWVRRYADVRATLVDLDALAAAKTEPQAALVEAASTPTSGSAS